LVVIGVALASLVAAIGWRSGRWRRQLIIGVPVAIVIPAAADLVLHLTGAYPGRFPAAAFLWGGAWVLAVVAAVVGWPHASGWVRVLSVVAVVLMAVVVADALNATYVRYPTIGRLIDLDAVNLVPNAQLQVIRDQVAKSGQLPSRGVVITAHIPAPVSKFNAHDAFVYLPPAWFATPPPVLPTLILLPGEPGSAADWTQTGRADHIADQFASTHRGMAPIIVMPDPNGFLTVDTECVNSSAFGQAETYLVRDVPAYARATFDASEGPRTLAVAGLSAGGFCAVNLALRNPTVFPFFASYSGLATPVYQEDPRSDTVKVLFGGSNEAFEQNNPLNLLKVHTYPGLAGWLAVGKDDARPLAAAKRLQPLAEAAGIDTCIETLSGGHDFGVWSQAFTDSLPWLSWKLGLTPQPATEPATCTPGR
jgi:S-formylglutathione hydrolase FrmB